MADTSSSSNDHRSIGAAYGDPAANLPRRFKYLLATQFLSRGIPFIFNSWIVRHLTEEDYALYAVQFHLFVTCVLFLSREGFRRACMRADIRRYCYITELQVTYAVQSKIPFVEFLFGVVSAMVVGICVNALILLCMFWKVLSVQKDEEEPPIELAPEEDVNSHRFSPATMSHLTSESSHDTMSSHSLPSVSGHIDNNSNNILRSRLGASGDNEILRDANGTKEAADNGSLQTKEEKSMNGFVKESSDLGLEDIDEKSAKWKMILWKIGVYVITVGMLVSFLVELNMSWTAITAAMALVVLDFKDARPCLEKVSYSLLVFFCGMFVTVEGFNRTGIPSAIWDFMEPYAEIDKVSGVAILAIVIVVLSNLASNVPTVLLLGSRVAAAAAAISPEKEKKAWLILAWVSTVAGNLSLLGSAANLIVCEQARRAQSCGYNLTFWAHLKFGVPSTIVVTAIGLTLIRA